MFITGLHIDVLIYIEAMSINEKFESDKSHFSEFVSDTIPGKTISHKLWERLDTQVKEELTRLGYKEEE